MPDLEPEETVIGMTRHRRRLEYEHIAIQNPHLCVENHAPTKKRHAMTQI
jgi:hypothetical protein